MSEERKKLNKEEMEELLKKIREGKEKISFDQCETFTIFAPAGDFIHNLEYVDDPLFYDAAGSTLECFYDDLGGENNGEHLENIVDIVTKKPATLTGYLLYDKNNNVIGFTCFNSQIIIEE